MRSTRGRPELVWLRVAVGAALTLTCAIPCGGQVDVTQAGPRAGVYDRPGEGPARDDPFASLQQKVIRQQQEKRNKARQEQLVTDTDKLLKLATELKAEVDKSNKDTLSVTVIKKSEEIEKLAKSVKDKMKNPI